MSEPGVAVVIPAKNEADRIAATVRAARALPGVSEVIVVDDGSRDDTANRAEAAGARVIRLGHNRGKGHALTVGVAAATGDILLFLDADLEESAREASALIEPVQSGVADMTVARFPSVPRGGGGWGNVVRLARWGIRRATGQTVLAPLSGQRCLRRAVWEATLPAAYGFGIETALTLDALQAGFTVCEIPVPMQHRATGRDLRGILHRARQFGHVLRALLPRLLHRGRRKA